MVVGFANGKYLNLEESFRMSFYPYAVYNPLGYLPSSLFLWVFSWFDKSVLELSDPFLFTPLQNLIARLGMQVWAIGFIVLGFKLISKLRLTIQTALICAVGLIPQLIFVQSYVNLDSIGLTIFLYLIWAIREEKEKHIALGCFLLSCCKMNFFCIFVLPLAFLFFKYKADFMVFLKKSIFVLVIPSLLGSLWFLFSYFVNTRPHGSFLGFNALGSIYNSTETGGFRIFSLSFLNMTLNSAFGRFGWMDLRYPEPIYSLWRVLILPAGFYLLCKAAFERNTKDPSTPNFAKSSLALVVLNLFMHYWASFTNGYQPQGRYILPAVIILQIYLVCFLSREPISSKRKKWLIVMCFFMTLSALAGVGISKKTQPNPPGLRSKL
jgi:hypothetical protein